MLKVVDFFCGAGGSSQGFHAIPGVTVLAAANHWDRALESHAANFPAARHYQGDIREMDMRAFPRGDLFWASPECFPAGTLILTLRGLLPIEDIREGDLVLTHRHRWRPVVATMSRPADTIIVKGVGLAGGLETTPEHPFYAREAIREWDNSVRQYRDRLSENSAWVPAQAMDAKLWATPVDFGEPLPVPPISGRPVRIDGDFWWMVGRWLGDGLLRAKPASGSRLPPVPRRTSQPAGATCILCPRPARLRRSGKLTSPYCSDVCKCKNKRVNPDRGRYEFMIVCSFAEAEELGKRLQSVSPLRWSSRQMRTATMFTTSHRGLVEWLLANFGQHAHGKTIPAWALTMPAAARAALLDGYLSADGHVGHATQVSTVSKRLAVGVRMLANSLGHSANLSAPYQRVPGRTIEGRPVSERITWKLSWITAGGHRRHFVAEAEGLRWLPARAPVISGRRTTVYNITVAEDESYLADGIVVHNCPTWSQARGKHRDFDKQPDLFGETLPDEATERSRALMWDVPRYLETMALRGEPVLAGVVENVTDVRAWDRWREWVRAIEAQGYKTRLIALNSMHARPLVTLLAPQSRDRLYLAYWLKSLGRDPDWDKWLRPAAVCPSCGDVVQAVQWWKRPGNDMGRYKAQYLYRCPKVSCRGQLVEPGALPAAAAIDWSNLGTRIGDRDRPLSPKTIARIRAGFERYARPITLEAAGNTFERRPGVRTWPVDQPLTTQTASETKGLAIPPVVVPAGGTWRDEGTSACEPMPARTCRENDGIAVPPFVVVNRDGERTSEVADPLSTVTTVATQHSLVTPPFLTPLRSGRPRTIEAGREPMATVVADGSGHGLVVPPFVTILRGQSVTSEVGESLTAVSAGGGHHGIVTPQPGQPAGWLPLSLLMRNNTARGDSGHLSTPVTEPARTLTTEGHQSLVTWDHLLVPYYGTGVARHVAQPVGTLSTKDRYALVSGAFDIDDALFRMLEPAEIGRAMAFGLDYVVYGNKREKTRQYGNAVTPPVAEVIGRALVECIAGVEIAA